jgi:hypothetical protein
MQNWLVVFTFFLYNLFYTCADVASMSQLPSG